MSRIGKNPIAIPDGVNCKIDGNQLKINGKLGALTVDVPSDLELQIKDNYVLIEPVNLIKQSRMLWGTVRSLASNAINGVSNGFSKTLQINGVGYRAAVQGSDLVLQLGFSHEVRYPIPNDITIKCEKMNIIVSGIDKQRVGQIASEIRSFRTPEPYKGKGIKYEDEIIVRKEGKKK